MGKYNKRTGIEVTGKICEVLKEPVLVGPFVSVLGFSSCPPTPVSILSLTGRKNSYNCVESNTKAFVYSIGRLWDGGIFATTRPVSRYFWRKQICIRVWDIYEEQDGDSLESIYRNYWNRLITTKTIKTTYIYKSKFTINVERINKSALIFHLLWVVFNFYFF